MINLHMRSELILGQLALPVYALYPLHAVTNTRIINPNCRFLPPFKFCDEPNAGGSLLLRHPGSEPSHCLVSISWKDRNREETEPQHVTGVGVCALYLNHLHNTSSTAASVSDSSPYIKRATGLQEYPPPFDPPCSRKCPISGRTTSLW